jgi:hypothetical protein
MVLDERSGVKEVKKTQLIEKAQQFGRLLDGTMKIVTWASGLY